MPWGIKIMEIGQNLFNSIFEKLEIMEQKRVVDLAIMPYFQALESQLSNLGEYCKNAKFFKTEDAFLLFHVLRSSRMIIEKIGQRFSEAKVRRENPVIVDLSRMLIPRVNDLFNTISPIISDEKHIISEEERSSILIRLKIMRDIASSTNMLPTIDEEKRGILARDLKEKFNNFANSFQESVEDEHALEEQIDEESDSC